jgi:acylphosphatase
MMCVCKKCFVTGYVQGVFYRASSQHQAVKLNITGYAKNLADGRVELLVCGEALKVELFIDWLWSGSGGSKVADVQCETVQVSSPKFFTTA